MAKTKYHIALSDYEKELLTKIICEGTESARTIMRAKILLMSGIENGKRLSVSKLAATLGTTNTTIQTVRTEYATEGFEYALYRKKREPMHYNSKASADVVRYIVALSQSDPPEGYKRWNCKLLAKAAVEEGLVESLSGATVLRILNETGTESSIIRRRRNRDEKNRETNESH